MKYLTPRYISQALLLIIALACSGCGNMVPASNYGRVIRDFAQEQALQRQSEAYLRQNSYGATQNRRSLRY